MVNIKLYSLLFLFFLKTLYSDPIEIDVTKGTIEPLPIAITKFNYKSIKEKIISQQIYEIVSNDLTNSGLFRKISNNAFLQDEEEVFFQPSFRDWSLIDANLIVSGRIKLNNNKLLINIKLWDVYREKLILSKKIKVLNDNNIRVLAHIVSNLVYHLKVTQKLSFLIFPENAVMLNPLLCFFNCCSCFFNRSSKSTKAYKNLVIFF